jgi:hypothetical protein
VFAVQLNTEPANQKGGNAFLLWKP